MLESIEKLREEIKDDLERTCGSSTRVRSERVLSALDEIEHEISEKYIALNRRGTTAFCGECGFGGWKERAQEYKDEAVKLLRDVLHVAPCYSPWDVAESAKIISERYILRPIDADGVPWTCTDEWFIDKCGEQHKLESMSIDADGTWVLRAPSDIGWHQANSCRHVKPRTVEDVLREFATEYADSTDAQCVSRYADKLRELLRTIWDDTE